VSETRIAIVGASGKMGRAIVRLAAEDAFVKIVCAVASDAAGRDVGELAGVERNGVVVTQSIAAIEDAKADVVIEFSSPAATREVADVASRAKIAIVSGTTGLDEAAERALEDATKSVAVFAEPNMSVGVYVFGDLLKRAIGMLGNEYDIEIVETHHGRKVDAPSGTANRLVEIARAARDEARVVHGRNGRPGARPKNEIGVHAIRGGDVIGDHTVHFLGVGERFELTHRATSRDVFANGALRAAKWIAGKSAGRYRFADILKT
jgi:4-hydroxy-tetrahydrodipicolinate reductase